MPIEPGNRIEEDYSALDRILGVIFILTIIFVYFQNFASALDVDQGDAVIVYGVPGTNGARWRTYSSSTNSWVAAAATISSTTVPTTTVIKTSPIKQEAIQIWQDSAGNMGVFCYNNNTWSFEFGTTSDATLATRRWFDVEYEQDTGDALVVYSRDIAATNEVMYRTKPGTSGCGTANWSAATNLDLARLSGTVQWAKLAPDPNATSSIAAIFADSNQWLTAIIWNGTKWVNEPSSTLEKGLEVVAAAQDVEDFDVAYESTSSEAVIVWANKFGSNGSGGVRYATMTGGQTIGSWTTATTATLSDDATNLDLAPNPLTNEMIFTSIGDSGQDEQMAGWNGSAWTNLTANVDTGAGTPVAGSQMVGGAFVTPRGQSFTGRTGVHVYNNANATTLNYRRWVGQGLGWADTGTAPSTANNNPTPGAPMWLRGYQNRFSSAMMGLAMVDINGGLFFKIATTTGSNSIKWQATEGGSALAAHVTQWINDPAAAAFWNYIPYATTTQAAYRWFNNSNTADVSGPLAAQDTAFTATSTGARFRLRMLVDIGGNQATSSSRTFKLQYAQKSGSCDTSFSGESYSDVTETTAIAYYDNPGVSDDATLTANGSDPTYQGQTGTNETYNEDSLTTIPTAVPSANVAKYDFSLYDNGAPSGTSYCFRMVERASTFSWSLIGGDGTGITASTYEVAHSVSASGTNLYAGMGYDSTDGDLYKYNGSSWSQIGGDNLNSGWSNNIAYTSAIFGNDILVGLGNDPVDTNQKAQLYRGSGGTWTKIAGDGVNSSWNTNFINLYSLASIGSTLYAGIGATTNNDEVWSYNGSTWTQIGGDGLNSGWTGLAAIDTLVASGTNLFAGTVEATGADLWKWNGTSWTKVGGDGTGWAGSTYEGVYASAVYKNEIYVGLGSDAGDAEVWKYDGTTWTQVGGDSVASSWSTGKIVRVLRVVGPYLYAGLDDPVSGSAADLWEYNGSAWRQVGGDSLFGSWASTYAGVLDVTSYQDKVTAAIGAFSAGDGEVWQMTSATSALGTYSVIPEITIWAAPTISQAYNMIFDYGGNASSTATLTVTDVAGGVITSTNGLRIPIATSTANMLWDTSDTQIVLGGTASTTKATTSKAYYEGGGSVLYIPIETSFAAGDTLTISGVSFKSFNTATSTTAGVLGIYKDGVDDQGLDATTTGSVAIRGVVALAAHTLGQITDRWSSVTPVTTTHFRLRLASTGENLQVSTTTFSLSSITGVSSSDITSAKLYKDNDSDGFFSTGDTIATSSTSTLPRSAGSVTEMSRGGAIACTAGSNYQCVDEDVANDDTDYVFVASGGTQQTDTYNTQDPVARTEVITNVRVVVEARQTTASTAAFRPLVYVGGIRYMASASTTPSISYKNFTADWATNPNTGSAWTWSDINSLQIGAFGVSSAGGDLRISKVHAEVWYEIPDGLVTISGASGQIDFATSTPFTLTPTATDYLLVFTASNLVASDAMTIAYNYANTTATGTISYLNIASSTGVISNITHTFDGGAGNTRPVISSLSFNSGNAINLNEGTYTYATATMTVTDADGCNTINYLSAAAYLASTTATSTTSCSPSDSSCYQSSSSTASVPALSNASCLATTTGNMCTGGVDTSVQYDCGFKFWYIATPTDTGTWASSIWSIAATTSDGSATSTASNTTQNVEINTLAALDISPASLSYGTVAPGANTGSTNSTTTVTNTGNSNIDPRLSGTDMTFGSEILLVGQQQYAADPFVYGVGAALTTSATLLDITLPAPSSTTTLITDTVSWGLAVPSGKRPGAYSGVNTLQI